MSFLLDTDICSAYLKGNRHVFNRFVQHSGGLHVSTVAMGELYTWGHRSASAAKRLADIADFLAGVTVVPVSLDVSLEFGRSRAAQMDAGVGMDAADLLIACTAIVHDFTLVTHNVKHFEPVRGLRIQ